MLICQYVSMSVCQYVSMSACQHVSMSACQHVNMSVCQYARFCFELLAAWLALSGASVGGFCLVFVFCVASLRW